MIASVIKSLKPAQVVSGIALYYLMLFFILSYFLPGGRSDDTEALLWSQTLEWGYDAKNPPLFYWLTWLGSEIFGPSPRIVFALRMFFLFLTLTGTYLLARRLYSNPLLVFAAGLSPLLMLNFNWYALHDLTHTIVAASMYPWSLLALFRLKDHPSRANYLLLGLTVCVGLYSKYTFLIFAAAVVISVASLSAFRPLLITRRIAWAFLPLLLFLPHGLWEYEHWSVLKGYLEGRIDVAPNRADGYLQGLVQGGAVPCDIIDFTSYISILVGFYNLAWV